MCLFFFLLGIQLKLGQTKLRVQQFLLSQDLWMKQEDIRKAADLLFCPPHDKLHCSHSGKCYARNVSNSWMQVSKNKETIKRCFIFNLEVRNVMQSLFNSIAKINSNVWMLFAAVDRLTKPVSAAGHRLILSHSFLTKFKKLDKLSVPLHQVEGLYCPCIRLN